MINRIPVGSKSASSLLLHNKRTMYKIFSHHTFLFTCFFILILLLCCTYPSSFFVNSRETKLLPITRNQTIKKKPSKRETSRNLSLIYKDDFLSHKHSSFLVTTLNGNVHAIDQQSYQTLWICDKLGGPLIRTSKQYSDIQVIPSINGNMYVYKKGDGIQKLPMTVNELVNRSPFYGNDGTLYTSSKSNEIYLVDSKSGTVVEDPSNHSEDIITIVRVNYHVKSMDAHDKSLTKWNFTYSEIYPLYQENYEDRLGALSTIDNHLYLFKRKGAKDARQAISLSFESQPMSVFRQLNVAHRIFSEPSSAKYRDESIFRKVLMPIQELSISVLDPQQQEQTIHIKHNKLIDSFYALELPKHLPLVVVPSKHHNTLQLDHSKEDSILMLPYESVPSKGKSTINAEEKPTKNNLLIDNKVWETNEISQEENSTSISVNNVDQTVENYTLIIENQDDIHPNIVQKDDQYYYILSQDDESNNEFDQNFSEKFTVTFISVSLIAVLSLTTIAIVIFIQKREARRKRRKERELKETAEKTGESSTPDTAKTPDTSSASTVGVTTTTSTNTNEYTIGNITLFYNEILGYGSNGTIVYNGVLKYKINEAFIVRKVAVKRMLKDFVKFAQKEISLLIESDSHTNIVRYYAQEEDEQFIYLALELCTGGTMEQYLQQHPDLSYPERQRILKQLVMAIDHIHQLGIVHRDLKPANILLDEEGNVKLSDMGLGKRLEQYQSSFYELSSIINTRHGNSGSSSSEGAGEDNGGKNKNAAIVGTIGWQAPEILLHIEQTLQQIENGENPTQTQPNENPAIVPTNSNGNNASILQNRMTKAVDVFALGCIIFFVLTGKHPYGRRSEREWNILNNKPVALIDEISNQSKQNQRKRKKHFHRIDTSVMKLIYEELIVADPTKRISASQLLKQCLFWDYSMKLHFLSDVSDQLGKEPENIVYKELQNAAEKIFNGNKTWETQIDDGVYQQIKSVRKYDYTRVWDVLRCIRNLKSHYREYQLQTTKILKCGCDKLPDGIFVYFDLEFPNLFPAVYELVKTHWSDRLQYKKYFY